MTNKKYQVFISSTFIDLVEERKKVLDILLMADCIPAGMEAFVATDNAQFEVIKKVIDLCDYYVLIIGKRYGSINEDTGISYTEMEYDYAKSKGIPVLVFALDDSVDLTEDKTESDIEKQYKLKLFKEKAMNNRLASIWNNNVDLAGQLAISIMRAKQEIVRPGWQRASEFDEISLRSEIVNLKEENERLRNRLASKDAELLRSTIHEDLAFEDQEITIKYHYYDFNKNRRNASRKVMLTDLYKVISTEMMDVAITETAVSNAIKKAYLSSDYYFSDNQFTKRLLNQFKVLGLIKSKWNNANTTLFWGVTEAGSRKRDEMILIRKNEDDVEEESAS